MKIAAAPDPVDPQASVGRCGPPVDAAATAVTLADVAASRQERWVALAIVLLSAGVLALVVPIAGRQWLAVPAFIPAYQSAAVVNELITAALLFGAFRESRRPSLLLLASGYLYTPVVIATHALSFPDVLGAAGLVGGPQTAVWLWIAWHLPLPVLVVAYAALAHRPCTGGVRGAAIPLVAVVAPLLLAGGSVLLATAAHDRLPQLLTGDRYIPGVTRLAVAVPLGLSLLALVLLLLRTRLRRSLDLWLALTMAAWAVEILLSAVLNSGRFQAGFYVGRLYGLLASCMALASLLVSAMALNGRVARELAADRDTVLAKLEDSEERLRLATEAAEIGFWDIDPIGDGLVWSLGVYAVFGVPPGTPVGRASFLAGLHPADRPVVEAAYAAAADPARRAVYDVEYRVIHKADGTVRWVASKGRGLFNETGHCVRVIGTARDVTARKRAEMALVAREAELRRLNETLEARVSEEVAAREQAQTQLAHAQRMEALGQLAGGIAHDFNNVLQAVQGGARLIEAAPSDTPRVLRLARMVADAAGRGASVTRRLLAFSRRDELRAEPIDPVDLLGTIREVLAHTMGAGIRVELAIEPGLSPFLADKGQLETALVNLATNARDAMAGQGTITLLAAAAAHLPGGEADRPRQLGPGTYVRLSVRDTGTGMDPAILARASEPFFTTKPEGKGTGLGLAMVRGFAEQSGGALHIASTAGQGTTVSLWLPVADAHLPAVAPAVLPAAGAVAHVLLVDDEAVVREITAEGLRAAGYDVLPAAGGAEALAILDAGGPCDILVSDLSMPGMDGLALVYEAQRRRPRLPAILLTGFVTDAAELAMGGLLPGMFSLLRKPIEARALADRVAVLLDGERLPNGAVGRGYPRR